MKTKPPRQAQVWSYFSHHESIGKALSSPGIMSNKNTHISCGSSARMADSVPMMEHHPCYPIWQHPIFSDRTYLSFKRDMLQIEAQEHYPAHTLLQQCVPAL
ncbi:hypothetical protein [Absidia glauca]|uniref:Ndc10 domain-containing protein n=1 Tax=Absidia glauca TaxID=4829 RepID=A0A163JNN9_ABSGL|nr:hypothetical protein [Absidia glauca]